jgi:iron(III) transport system permease protein
MAILTAGLLRRDRRGFRILELPRAAAVTAIVLAILTPIVLGLFMSLRSAPIGEPGTLTLGNYGQAIGDKAALVLIGNTALLTVCGAGGATVLGVAMAWIVTSTDVAWPKFLIALPMAPALIPGLMKDTGWINLYSGRAGLVNVELERVLHFPGPIFNIYSMPGMIIVSMLSATPLAYIVMLPAFRGVGGSLVEASRTVGVGRFRSLVHVVLPVVRPAIYSALALTAVSVAAAFETPILIGLPAGKLTYISAIYQSIELGITPQYNLAAAQAMVYLVLTGALLTWYLIATRKERRFAVVGGRDYAAKKMQLGWWRWLAFALVIAYFAVAFVQLVAGTVIQSLLPYYTATVNPLQHWTLSNWGHLFAAPEVLQGIKGSLELSLIVSVLTPAAAATLGWLAVKGRLRIRRAFDVVGTIPIGIPPLVFSVFLLMTVLFIPFLQFAYNSEYSLVVADVVVLLPYSMRIISASVIQIHDDMIDAPRTLGSSTWRSVRAVIFPLLRTAIVGSFVLTFALSFRELGAITLLTGPNIQLLPNVIFNQWDTGQNIGLIAALNLLSIGVTGGALLLGMLISRALRFRGTRRLGVIAAATTA